MHRIAADSRPNRFVYLSLVGCKRRRAEATEGSGGDLAYRLSDAVIHCLKVEREKGGKRRDGNKRSCDETDDAMSFSRSF